MPRPIPADNSPSSACLRLEALEDRTLLAGGLVGNLVSFGDSLSDVGNTSLATGGAIPGPLYYQGRFSGGPIWLDKLAQVLHEPAVKPALAGGLDYAFGGATVAFPNTVPPFNAAPTLPTQALLYLAGNPQLGLSPHTPGGDDLFTLLGGADDFFYSAAQSPTGTPIDPTVVAGTLVSTVSTLYAAGGRNFAVANLPPLGQIPYFQDALKAGAIPQSVVDGANLWTAGFDFALQADLNGFAGAHHDARVAQVDTAGLFTFMQLPSNPLHFANRANAVGPYGAVGSLLTSITVAHPDSYLYYDGVHPGTRAQQALGLVAAVDVFEAGIVHRPHEHDEDFHWHAGAFEHDSARELAFVAEAVHAGGCSD
jgi:phospholipase/lecithinase/hemolysin